MQLGEIIELIELLELSLSYNYFGFNDKIYYQSEGLAMGNSLAGTLAEIFINNLEYRFFETHKNFAEKIIYYRRYVDDIIVMIKGTETDMINLQAGMNSMHNKITFTSELEQNNSLNFLDLTIRKENKEHVYSIYRKSTTCDTIIHASSCHPLRYKLSFFNSMIYRLLKIPLKPAEVKKELNILKQIAVANGYNDDVVMKTYKKLKNKSTQKM